MPNLGHFEITIIMRLLFRKTVQVLTSLLDINNVYNGSGNILLINLNHLNKQGLEFNIVNM